MPYQKSLKASLDAPAVLNGTLRLVNTQVIPRALRGLDFFDALLREGGALVSNFDSRLNGESGLLVQATMLLVNMNVLAGKFGLSVNELNSAVKMAAEDIRSIHLRINPIPVSRIQIEVTCSTYICPHAPDPDIADGCFVRELHF